MSLTKRWLAIGTGLALGATACGGGGGGTTGPATLSDPVATAAKLDTVAQPLSTPQFQSFGALATRFTPVAAATSMAKVAALLAATRPEVPSASGLPYARSAQKVRELERAMPFRTSGPSGAIFPPTVLGKTYVWSTSANSGAGGYVSSTLAGAPSTGVRFILYAINPLTDQPSTPLTEIGYADLIDKSSGSTTSMEVVVVGTSGASPVTYVDYTISGTFSSTSATASVAGYATDGKTRLDFTVTISGTESASGGSFTFNSTFNVAAKSIAITFNITATSSVSASSETLTLTLHFSLAVGSETVTADGPVTVTSTSTSITTSGTITVKVNGGDFATITITNSSTTLTGAGGRALTANEQSALDKIFEVPDKIFEGLGDLLLPAEVAFGFTVP